MALHWIMYVEPGARHLEAFSEELRYNVSEVAPQCWELKIRRMDDPSAELRSFEHSFDAVKTMAESVKPGDITRPKMEEKLNGNPA